jgi:uncharacterized protein
MVDKAEQFLIDKGYHQLRVRIHDKIARIEVMPDEFSKILEDRDEINTYFKLIGFTFVTLDLTGYTMGSMNKTL